MAHVELSYNPYLLETEVRFNGIPPRINSLVEKYQNEKLQVWVNEIPLIFYDEMNGYDFELDFSGTELDFEELKKSFVKAGVGKKLVQLFHKGELDSRKKKTIAIDNLLNWLMETPNRKFDLEGFQINNKEFFDSAYPFVVVGGKIDAERLFEDIDITIDNVESVEELRKTDLHSTPILLYLDRKTVGSLQNNLRQLLGREDVTQEQLFFMISPVLGGKTKRVIRDLGITEPQIVMSADDTKIYRYFELFPISEYIYDAIKIFRKQTNMLSEILKEENKQSEIANKDIHEKIKSLDNILNGLKESKDYFVNKDNLDLPSELNTEKANLLTGINRWRIKKTKITKKEEARSLSYEYETEINRLFDGFKQSVIQTYSVKCAALLTSCDERYRNAKYNESFKPDDIEYKDISEHLIPQIADKLIEIKEDRYVMPKEAFFGKLFKASQEDTPQEPILETTYYYEKWRSYAAGIVEPIADEVIQEIYSSIKSYYDKLSDAYIKHIEILLQEVAAEKEQVSSQLSEDEHLLQIDNDWLTIFCDKLRDIERS